MSKGRLDKITGLQQNAVSFSPCERSLATAGDGGTLIIHSLVLPLVLPVVLPVAVVVPLDKDSNTTPFEKNPTIPNINPIPNPAKIETNKEVWPTLTSEKQRVTKNIPTHSSGIMDIAWNSKGNGLVVCTIHCTVLLFRRIVSCGGSATSISDMDTTAITTDNTNNNMESNSILNINPDDSTTPLIPITITTKTTTAPTPTIIAPTTTTNSIK